MARFFNRQHTAIEVKSKIITMYGHNLSDLNLKMLSTIFLWGVILSHPKFDRII